jgi:hypothetical protein
MAALNRNYEFKKISHDWVQKISFSFYSEILCGRSTMSSGLDALLPSSPFTTIYSTRQDIIWQRSNNVLIREVLNRFHLHRMQVYNFHTLNKVTDVASKRYYHMTFYTKKYTQTTAQKLGPICLQWLNHVFS